MGRKPTVTKEIAKEILEAIESGLTANEVAQMFRVSDATVYRIKNGEVYAGLATSKNASGARRIVNRPKWKTLYQEAQDELRELKRDLKNRERAPKQEYKTTPAATPNNNTFEMFQAFSKFMEFMGAQNK